MEEHNTAGPEITSVLFFGCEVKVTGDAPARALGYFRIGEGSFPFRNAVETTGFQMH